MPVPVAGWPVYDGGPPIDSTPSVANLTSTAQTVFIGSGNAAHPADYPGVEGYSAYSAGGQELWHTNVTEPPTDAHPAYGVQASLTVANLQGATDVFAGSLGQEAYALDGATGSVLPGWPFFSADSIFSTAAVADLYGTGQDDLVVGGASTAGLAYGTQYQNGGHIRILSAQGQLLYDYDTTQEVDSSPAIGGFLSGGSTGTVVGTGSYWPGASDTDTVKAFTSQLGLVWSDTLDGLTSSSPALADVQGNGQLDVVEGTCVQAAGSTCPNGSGGSVWVLDGADGATIWHQPVVAPVIGSVVTADLSGQGYQDLLVPTIHGVEILDGLSGAEVTVLGPDLGFQNSPLVTEDPNGTVGVTIAGYNGDNEGVIQHYEIPGSDGALAVGTGSWPMFHHDPSLSGAVPPSLPGAPVELSAAAGDSQVSLSWTAPEATGGAPISGYDVYVSDAPGSPGERSLTATASTTASVGGLADGTVYYFEVSALNAAGEGPPSAQVAAMPTAPPAGISPPVSSPVSSPPTTSAAQPGATTGRPPTSVPPRAPRPPPRRALGYRVVTAGGEVLSVGQLKSYPSQVPTSPVVGIAPTPDDRGYWLALRDGRALSAGDAPNYGPASSGHLSGPVVGIAAMPGGRGYWLVTANGGVVAFGDARAYRPSRPVNEAVVGIAATEDGRGYWLVAADGGVFSFGDARAYGSLASRRLNKAVVGMAATADGRGYWLVAADGGVFGFGDARYLGRAPARDQDVVGIAS